MWRRDEILGLRKTGITWQAIGDRVGISKERARQIGKGKPERKPKLPKDKTMLGVNDVAQLLGIHVNTVRRWTQRGVLKVYRLGTRGDRRFRRQDIEAFLMVGVGLLKGGKQMATEVEILGHKAKIESVRGQAKTEPWHKEDQLVVWLAFDEPVDGTLSFAVLLPVKKYERDEFLYNVRRRGEEELKRIMEQSKKDKVERQEREERKKALDAVAAEAQSLIE